MSMRVQVESALNLCVCSVFLYGTSCIWGFGNIPTELTRMCDLVDIFSLARLKVYDENNYPC